jgi:hypothetical protein
MPGDNASLVELLTEALTESQNLTRQVKEQTETIDRLFRQCAEKDIEIASLKRDLKVAQAKEQKLRLEQPHLSSPVMSDDVEQTLRAARSATPKLPLSKHASPKSSPRIEVASSPPRKRQRIATAEKTPLQEVTNLKAAPRGKDRVERVIEAIPSLAEDGEWESGRQASRGAGLEKTDGIRTGAQRRLGALLDAPAPHYSVLEKRPISVSPKAQPKARAIQPPSLQRSSSDSVSGEKPPLCRKPPFLPPKPLQRKKATPLRSRRPSSLHLSDFVPRQGLLDEWDRPRAKKKFTYHSGETSDDEVLLEYLGPGGEEKLATMTRSARENLLHDARLKKMATRMDEARTTTKKPGNGPSYWEVDFPRSQEEEMHRAARLQSLREEVTERFREALGTDGRWQFRDEVKDA